jgi:hypothetical protein
VHPIGRRGAARRARFYILTKAGRKHVERVQAGWERLAAAIALP